MLGIKKQLIKNMIKLEIVHNTPGQLGVYISQIKKIDEEYKTYEYYAQNAIGLIKGIQKIVVDYDDGLLTIYYNNDEVSPQKIYKWLQLLVDIGVDNYDDLKALWNENKSDAENIESIWQTIKPVLLVQLTKLR